jgi:two-component system cell cycle response regulator
VDTETSEINPRKKQRKALTIKAIIVRISLIVLFMEVFIMKVLGVLPSDFNKNIEAILDAASLVTLSVPLIYFLVIRPFVVARDQAEAEITHLAFHDVLTNLPNRRLLLEILEKYLIFSKRHSGFGALIFIDLNDFKIVNDTYGHLAGDALLIEAAKRLKAITRAEDTVSRLGGDEFVLLAQHLDGDKETARIKATKIAEKIYEVLTEPVSYAGQSLKVGASIGIRLLGSRTTTAESAMSEADTAMYRAKQNAKERIAFFDER